MERKVIFVCAAVGFLGLLSAALAFAAEATRVKRGQQNTYFGNYCYVVKPGVFAGGAVLSLASVSLGIVYYVSLSTFNNSIQPQSNQGIAMAQPEIPPQSTQPVFVHEDTYKRRQFP
ncbi:hypothetical protein J5N97_029511 [Dioscorea zingiberensis]|uniref:Uncharacterized protein n=1 Tax=Dioscorea zingiberensis TaxID=325984 RepID=A0A9D5C1H3_9LILI|nr:hypothetical protein J5N97_029511 [Dioscorea zingiberensis]